MHLTDSHLAWMLTYGVSKMRFDAQGNVLEVEIGHAEKAKRSWNNVTPEAPVPPPVPEPTDEEIRKAAIRRRKQIAAEAAADRAAAYTDATGLPMPDGDEG